MHIDQLKRFVQPLERRVRTMLMRATLQSVDDSQDLQQMQISRLDNEVLEGCERVGQYGLASFPPAGSEVIVGQIGSNADHQVVLGVDGSARPHPIDQGQTIIYDSAGTRITLDAAGSIQILTTGTVTVTGDMSVSGNLLVHGNLTAFGECTFTENVLISGSLVVIGTINGTTIG